MKKCCSSKAYSKEYDAYYCKFCNVWLEKECSDNNCYMCRTRPERPLDNKENKKNKVNIMKENTIEELAKTFEDHHQLVLINRHRDIENFKMKYPEEKIPEHFMNDFSISEALAFMCREIKSIQESLNERLNKNDNN